MNNLISQVPPVQQIRLGLLCVSIVSLVESTPRSTGLLKKCMLLSRIHDVMNFLKLSGYLVMVLLNTRVFNSNRTWLDPLLAGIQSWLTLRSLETVVHSLSVALIFEHAVASMITPWLGMGRVNALEVFKLLRVESVFRLVHGMMPRDSSALSDRDFKSSRHVPLMIYF